MPPGSRQGEKEWVHLDADTPCRVWPQGEGSEWRSFTAGLEQGAMHPEILTLPPRRRGTGAGITAEQAYPGEELLYVIRGKVRMYFWDADHDRFHGAVELQTGEVLHYRSSIKHYAENAQSAYAAHMLVVRQVPTAPSGNSRPAHAKATRSSRAGRRRRP